MAQLEMIPKETLKEIMLPIPEMEVQSKIKDKIIESFNLRKQCAYWNAPSGR